MECFFTANGGLFERPTAAFFTVAAAGVMLCMTVVTVVTTSRKTRFPTGVTTSATKAKPPAAATAFCILSSPYIILEVVAFAIGLLISLLRKRLRLIATPTELLSFFVSISRIEVLRPSTLGCEIATPTELPGCVPSQPSSWGRNTMSMVSRMNGHLSCLDEYALIIAALYFFASYLSTPAYCVPSHRWVIKKGMGAILFGAHSFPTMIVGSVTSLSFDLIVHSHLAMSRRGLPLRQSLDEGCQE